MASVLIVGLTALGSCSGSQGAGSGSTDRLSIAVTTTVIGDIVESIVGSDGMVSVLTPAGTDPHDYRPSAQQVASLHKSDLVVANGLGLEEGLIDVLESAARDGVNVLEIGPRLDPVPLGGEREAESDPHVWMDPRRMADAARLIGAELDALDDSVDWVARGEAYAAELMSADRRIEQILAAVPSSRRKLVTNHDSLGYFAARYGFEIIGVVIPGGSTTADPSSAELAALVRQIEQEDVAVIFVETTEASDLAEAVAAEVGEGVEVVELFTGSLGEDQTGADTLIGMLTTNARRIAEALTDAIEPPS